jgi:thiol-disulfide isomerase/thioredoxin
VAAKRSATAKPGLPFLLVEIATGKTVSLDDYRGRVVLVNFWYPLCGPCRGEFPFLQQVLAKYRDRGFALLAINGHHTEEHLVAGLLRSSHLEFTALRGDDATIDAYQVDGYPSNFLYGPDGRICHLPPTVSGPAARRALELQIEALLPPPKA